MHYVVKPCGTFGVKRAIFIAWVNAIDHALALIESGKYSRVMFGKQTGDLYEALGYITREDGVLRWIGFAGPPTPATAAEIVANQVRGYRRLVPCS